MTIVVGIIGKLNASEAYEGKRYKLIAMNVNKALLSTTNWLDFRRSVCTVLVLFQC